jgi:hypothetical protein
MKNRILLLVLACMMSAVSFAQKSWRMGVGLNGGIATKDNYNFILGADARFQRGIGESTSLIVTGGVTHFFKTNKVSNSATFIPVKLGFKHFLNTNFYAAAEAGAAFSVTDNVDNSFIWSPSIGFAFKEGIDISVKYEDITKYKSTKQFALRIAYGFKL